MRIHEPFGTGDEISNAEGVRIVKEAVSSPNVYWNQTGSGELQIEFDGSRRLAIKIMGDVLYVPFFIIVSEGIFVPYNGGDCQEL